MEELDRRSLQNRLIPGNIAFHSRAMDPIKDDVLDALSFLDDRGFDGDVPFVSSVTGVETERLDSAYWWSNIRQPVRFAAAMETVKRDHRPVVVLELAPHSALQPLVAQCTVEDPRRAYAEELMSATNVVDTLAGIHRIDMDEPEEDFMLLRLAFATWIITVAHHVPAYGRWLAETGSRDAYAHHRRVMQHFTWQRRQREPEEQRFWLLKMPFHLMELGVLLETYPDAVFIQTHREPAQFMGSWNSLVERIRSFTTEPRPPRETGAEQLALMSRMLNGAVRFRASHPAIDRRWVDVSYAHLVADPMAVVADIYGRFGWPSSWPPSTTWRHGSPFRQSSAGMSLGTSTDWRTMA